MKKYILTLLLFLGVSAPVMAQNDKELQDNLVGMDMCSGIMSPNELLKAAEILQAQNNNESDFFATNCIMVAAHKGSAEAQYQLSQAYKNAKGISKNDAYAYKWLKISEIHGKKISAEEFKNLEKSMTISDVKQAKAEIQNYLSFEKSIKMLQDRDFFKQVMMKNNYKNITPDMLTAIEKKQDEIEGVFNVDFSDIKVKEESTPSTFIPPVNENYIYDESYYNREGMPSDIMGSPYEQEMNMDTSMEKTKPQKTEKKSSKNTSSSSSNDSSASVDFFTDKYNK